MNKLEAIPCRGRPREFCVDGALAEALRVFWEKGYEGTSLNDLTEAMGITRPSLYAAFGNKESLFRKALDLYEREKLAYIRKALEQPTAEGDLPPHIDPEGLMRVLIAMLQGISVQANQGATREELDRLVESGLALWPSA